MLIHPWDQATREEWQEVLRRHDFGHHEPPGSTHLTPSVEIESDRRQLSGIRGIRLRIEAVRAKQKYAGNKDLDHRLAIAEHLAERGAPGDAAAREHLLRRGT